LSIGLVEDGELVLFRQDDDLGRAGAAVATRATAEPRRAPLLRVENARLGYRLGDAFHVAVASASFEVGERERVIVIGRSGCGKSTLLKAVAGFEAPVAGTIAVAGRSSLAPGPDRAVVFQEFDQLFPWRTVLDNVAYPLRVNGRSRRAAADVARELLGLTGLSDAADRYPHQLSGGMKQRAAIARALALEPSLLLMDEPFGALDAITRQRLQAELNEIVARTQVALLFVTHSIEEALILGDRVVVLAGAPSSVADVVTVGDADQEETASRLRTLLAADSSEDADGDRR
jgi:NitT/TauT family transport system ATP-binding protein